MPGDRARGLTPAELGRLFLRAPFGVAFLDRTCRYVSANEAFAKLPGLTSAPDAGSQMADTVPSLWPALEPLLERAHSGDVISRVVITGSGASADVCWRLSAYPVPLPRHRGIGLVVDDLTVLRPYEHLRPDAAGAQTAVENEPIGNWSLDLRTGMTYWSEPLFEIFGLPGAAGAIDDDRVLERVHADDRSRHAEARLAALAGQPHDQLFRIVLPDGTTRRVRSIGEVHHDVDGRPIRISGTLQDVTERRRAEPRVSPPNGPGDFAERRRTAKALAESERHLRALTEELAHERSHLVAAQAVANMGSWSTELSGMTVVWSAQTHRIFETDPATFAPSHQRFLAMVHPDDRAAVDLALTASLTTHTTHSIAHRIQAPSGRVKFVEEAWRVTHDDDGTPRRAIGTIQDVTDRRHAEERERASHAHLRAVLNNAPLVLLAVDADGRFTMSEGQGLEAAGLAPGQVVGLAASDLYGTLDIVQADGVAVSGHEAVRRVLAGERVTGLTQVGSEYFENQFVPGVDATGRVVGMIGVSTVVTARRRAELRVQHMNRVYAMLSGINETIVREPDSGRMLDAACRLAVERGEFAMAWIGLVDDAGALHVVAHAGANAAAIAVVTRVIGAAPTHPGSSVTARAMHSGRPASCNNIANDPLAQPWRALAQEQGYSSMASLPLVVNGAVIGTFNLYARSAAVFDTEELRLLEELAMDIAFGLDVHARAVERQRIVTELRDSEVRLRLAMSELRGVSGRLNEAREQERAAMARDIHDHFGQSLTAMKMDIGEIRRRLDAGDTALVRERLTQMSALLDSSMDDVRRVAAELRPVVLDDLGFVAAIRAYLVDFESRAHMRCVLRTTLIDLAIADDRATALFRILQEALTNAVRHSAATTVVIGLTVHAGRVRLVIHDDGRGIPAGAVQNPRALGLIGMRDRARLFGGDVIVAGGPGAGTTVSVDIPLDGAPA